MGELLVVAGLAFYPNLGTAEAFAIVNVRGRHTTVRAHKKLGTDRMDMVLGPLSFEVVEPFRRWRLRLDPAANEHGIGYDITWLDTKRPTFRQLGAGMIVGGRAVSPIAGYDGFGRQEGWVESAGERFTLSTLDAPRHTGSSLGHPRRGRWPRPLHGDAAPAQWRVGRVRGVRHLGRPRALQHRGRVKRSGTLSRRVHRMQFEPDTHLLQSGEVDLVFADGSVKTMTFERLGNQIAFLRCGLYGGPNGGTPDGDLWHGMPVAQGDEVVVHGETFDVNDPDVRRRLAGQDQHHCRVQCEGEVTYGLVEP